MIELLDRVGRKGPSPVFGTALRQHPDPAVDAEARAVLTERIVDPLQARIDAHRDDARAAADARLRAEIIAAAFIGVAVGRHVGAFPALSAAATEQVSSSWRGHSVHLRPAQQTESNGPSRMDIDVQCPRWDSNPHWNHFKWPASADWATGAQTTRARHRQRRRPPGQAQPGRLRRSRRAPIEHRDCASVPSRQTSSGGGK